MITNTTNDKAKYTEAWKFHIQQLNTLGYPLIKASTDQDYYQELQAAIATLNKLVDVAANTVNVNSYEDR